MVEAVLVARLKRLYWPKALLQHYTLQSVLRAPPECEFRGEASRTEAYDLGRVRYFYEQIHRACSVEPILIDWTWNGYSPARIVLIDGHHRFAAHVLAAAPRIAAQVGGPVDVCAWLTGARRRIPRWV